MNESDLQSLIQHLPADFGKAQLVETHISQVLLGDQHVYKIKKPLKYSFLDFSSLEQRKHFCEEELRLNRRLTEDIYLSVETIVQRDGSLHIGGEGKVVDYALRMKRLPTDRQMDCLLEKDQVTLQDLQAVSAKLTGFHTLAERIPGPADPEKSRELFNDLTSVADFLVEKGLEEHAALIQEAIKLSDRFLDQLGALIRQRGLDGWVRDVHGDLHSRNIFLTEEPVIFDCIEFNAQFRQLDLLDEIAFFCMDLEAFGHPEMARSFLRYYFEDMQWVPATEEKALFVWFKAYRANVRAKVNALRAMQAKPLQEKRQLEECRRYLDLMMNYLKMNV